MTLSQSLYLLSGIACSTSRPTRYFMNTILTSPTSIELDCDRKRFSRSMLSVACMVIVKPRSFVACSPICGIAATGGPACRRVMSLMFCAQIVGNPVSAPEPAERPASAAPLCKTRRRETPPLLRRVIVPVVFSFIPCSSASSAVSRRIQRAASGGPAHIAAAMHQRQDAGAELLHADDEIVEGQHHAAHPRHRGHLVQHLRDSGIGADKHALVGRQFVDAEGSAAVRLGIGVLARIVLRLGIA